MSDVRGVCSENVYP